MDLIVKKCLLIVSLLLVINNTFGNTLFSINPKKEVSTVLTEEESNAHFEFPYAKQNFNYFKEALAFKESQGNYSIVNKFGYLGKYQFGRTTLERFKIYNTDDFLMNPELQEKAFIALCEVNKWILRKDIRRSVGKVINGIVITESGILAAAHLGGAGNVKKFLRSQGRIGFEDALGTSIQSYMKLFAAYNTSLIIANRLPIIV